MEVPITEEGTETAAQTTEEGTETETGTEPGTAGTETETAAETGLGSPHRGATAMVQTAAVVTVTVTAMVTDPAQELIPVLPQRDRALQRYPPW